VQRGSFPVDDVVDVNDRSDLPVDGLEYSSPFLGWGWPVHTYVGQYLVELPPITAAMSLVIKLRYHLRGVYGIRRDVGRVYVIRMAGAARIVGNHHLWSVVFDELPDRTGGRLDGYCAKGAFAVLRIPLRHAGVVVAEQFEMRDSQALAGAAELTLPDVRHLNGIVAVRAGLDTTRPVTEPAVRARDDNGPYPFKGVMCKNSSG